MVAVNQKAKGGEGKGKGSVKERAGAVSIASSAAVITGPRPLARPHDNAAATGD